MFLEGRQQHLPLHPGQTLSQQTATPLLLANLDGKIGNPDQAAPDKGHKTLDDMLQLSDISRKVISDKERQGIGIKTDTASPVPSEKMLGQFDNIRASFPQGRNEEFQDIETEEQIFTEPALCYHLSEITVGCGQDPDIDNDGGFAAQTTDMLVLQGPQQFCLEMERQFAHFIKKQGAALGLFKQTSTTTRSTSEGPFFMAEKLGFKKILRYCGTINLNKRGLGSDSLQMDQSGRQFLAGACLTADQGRPVGLSHPVYQGEDFLHDPARTDNGKRQTVRCNCLGYRIRLVFHRDIEFNAPDFLEEDPEINGFFEKIICPELHDPDSRIDTAEGRDHNGPDQWRRGPELAQHLITVDIIHTVVKEDQMDRMAGKECQSFLAAGCRENLVPLFFQETLQHVPLYLLIVDNKYPHGFHLMERCVFPPLVSSGGL